MDELKKKLYFVQNSTWLDNKQVKSTKMSWPLLLSPATKWKGDIGLGAVRHSVRLSRNRFRSITQKLFNISKPNLVYS